MSSSATIKLATKNIKWMLSTFKEKIIKSEGFLLLTAIKWNISSSSIGELSKIMSVAFHDSKTAVSIELSEAKARYHTKFGFALNKCSDVNKT